MKETAFMTEISPTPIEIRPTEETKRTEQDLFRNIPVDYDNNLKQHRSKSYLFETAKRTYEIEDRKYTIDGHKGKLDVHYPVLQSLDRDMTVVNSVILAKVVNQLVDEDDGIVMDTKFEYTIETATDNFISILYTGMYNQHDTPHPYSTSFTINFDLKRNMPLKTDEVVDMGDNILEQLHGAIKKQLDKEGIKAFEDCTQDYMCEQIYKEFYVAQQKIYIGVSITSGVGYYEYISFGTKK